MSTYLEADGTKRSVSDANPLPVKIMSGAASGGGTGDASAAKQDIGNTRLGDVVEAAPASDTASSGLNGRLQRIAQRLTSLIGLLPSSIGQKAASNSLSVVLASNQGEVPVNGIPQVTAVDRGVSVGTSSTAVMAANSARRGVAFQNQSTTATVYISGLTAATTDFHSLMLGPGQYFETSSHTGTGAITAIATAAATPLYAREW